MGTARIDGIETGAFVQIDKRNGASYQIEHGVVTVPPPTGSTPGEGEFLAPPFQEGRVTRIVPGGETLTDVNSVRILSQPAIGQVSVNDDNSISWVLSQYKGDGTDVDGFDYDYDLTSSPGSFVTPITVSETLTVGPVFQPWCEGGSYYFEVDAGLSSNLEPGLLHRKYYGASDGHTKAAIAAAHVIDVSAVNNAFLATTIAHASLGGDGSALYAETEATALESSVLFGLWKYAHPTGHTPRSDWLLLKRGQTHDNSSGGVFEDGFSGESAMHPTVIGDWGTGDLPVLTSSINIQYDGPLSLEPKNIVFRNLRIPDRLWINGERLHWQHPIEDIAGNWLWENLFLDGGGSDMPMEQCNSVALRDVVYYRQHKPAPLGVGGVSYFWNESGNRSSGAKFNNATDIFMEGCIAFHSGWEDGYDPWSRGITSPIGYTGTGGQPTSAKSQGAYVQKRGWAMHVSGVAIIAASGCGFQGRAGGQIQEMLLIGNNQQAFTGMGSSVAALDPVRNFSGLTTLDRCVATSAAYRQTWQPKNGTIAAAIVEADCVFPIDTSKFDEVSGAEAFGLVIQGRGYASMVECLACHKADPNNPAEIALKTAKNNGLKYTDDTAIGYFNSNISFNWVGANNDDWLNMNADTVNATTANATTIQNYVAGHANIQTFLTANTQYAGLDADIQFGEYICSLPDQAGRRAEQLACLNYFRAGFGLPLAKARTVATSQNFLASPIGSGIAWFERWNWSGGELIDGDSINLRGLRTEFFDMTLAANNINLAGGRVRVSNGRLAHTGTLSGGGELAIRHIGRFHSPGYTDTTLLDVEVAGGRFLNSGTWDGNADFTVTGGQLILAESGGAFTLQASNAMTITGAPKIGFDETGGGTATGTFEGTLAFVAAGGAIGTIGEFHSGRNGATATSVTSTIVLASGSTVTVDSTGLASGTYDLIDVDSLTDSGATLPAGVAVSGNKLQLTVA